MKEKCLESFNSAKCKMLKHRNSKWDNPHKHQFPLKKKKTRNKKIDIGIFLIYQILTDLKDYVKCLGQ